MGSFARATCKNGPSMTPLVVNVVDFDRTGFAAGADAPDMEATQSRNHPVAAIVSYGRWGSINTGVDGWLFRARNWEPEPCPEGAFDVGPLLDAVPSVAEIMAHEGALAMVFVEHPRNDTWVYVYTKRGGGEWRLRTDAQVAALMELAAA